MSCEGNVCGTGGWNGPQPGDPDNNITLSVRSVFSGLLVAWSYPLINPNAVAYTDVYRSDSSDFNTAVKLTQAGGASYLDRLDPKIETEYFYWIEVVSIHGTRGARIGPAMGIARPVSVQTIESLTGMIDASLLSQTLKTDIAGITLNNAAIIQEIKDRIANNVALQDALAAVQGGVDEALTYVLNEITERTDADGAMVTQINAIAAGLNEAKVAITQESTVRATKDEVLASRIDAMSGEFGSNEAAIIEERRLRITADNAIIEDYLALYGRVGNAEGAITDISSLNISPTTALATRLNTLSTGIEDSQAAIEQIDTTVSTKIESIASSVQTVESAVNGNVATGQVGLTTKVNTVTGALDSMWFAKVQANGLIGGFGLWNNSQSVVAGFDVDQFWIGRTGDNAVKPFIIDNGITYIDKARIRNADIDSLKIAGSAVTVPISVRMRGPKFGNGRTFTQMIRGYIKLDVPGIVYAHCICSQRYGKGVRYWSMRISVGGEVGSTVGGQSVVDTPVIAQSKALGVGVHPIVVEWWGENDGVYIESAELFIIGAKR